MDDRYEIRSLRVGEIATNCYLMKEKASGRLIVVDPGDEAERIAGKIREMEGRAEAILLTHSHHDHILGLAGLKEAFPDAEVIMAAEEEPMLDLATPFFSGVPRDVIGKIDRAVHDGDGLSLIGTAFTVLVTPGHTAGSACFYCAEQHLLFSGDTLFYGSCGRTDLPGGDSAAMMQSLARLAREIPDDTDVLPGHMNATQMGFEKQYNPYMPAV